MPGRSDELLAVAGATGFVGRRLVPALIGDGFRVRCLVRDAGRARAMLGADVELAEVDLEHPGDLARHLEGCRHAYFLVHLMASEGADFPDREREAAHAFARAAITAGVGRMSYLGGLGGRSPHLRSRHSTAQELADHGPPLTYFRAAMIVGPGSESYELLRSIVMRLPVAPAPSWLENRTQPIGVRDVVAYLRRSPAIPVAAGREVQIGGPDPMTHRELIDELARQMGAAPRRWLALADRIATPEVMAAGAATVTRGDRRVAAALTMGLQEDTVVEDPTGAQLFGVRTEPISVVFQRCLAEEERASA
jgi:uncharacterized protein YbjT (DUF2867 family)